MHIADLAGKDSHSRRFFMEKTAKTALGVSAMSTLMPAAARAQANGGGGQAKHLIYIYLSGGMTHLDTFDCTNKSDKALGDTKPISTNVDGIQLGPQFEKLSKKADKLAIINSMNSTNGAHDQGRYWMLTGYEKRATIVHPRMGSMAEELLGKRNDVLPDSVVIGQSTSNAGYLDPALSPLPIADPSGGVPNTMILTQDDRFKRRMEIANKLGKQFSEKFQYAGPRSYVEYYDQATKLLEGTELEAFDITGESMREQYGMGRLGQGLLLARRLVENGVRVIEVHSGGWDMHEGIQTRLAERVTELDTALGTLLEDLEAKGLLDSTLVAVSTEFGRTPDINMNSGRDHFPAAFSSVLAGGGIVGGQLYGKTDKMGKKVEEGKTRQEDFLATVGYGLGVPLDETVYSPSRRPFKFGGKDGVPITKLYG
ncbi:MAG: hypothetical protein ACI8UO_004588 [Verrucomicrobiales bacterium]|jgi:hypothetical protein